MTILRRALVAALLLSLVACARTTTSSSRTPGPTPTPRHKEVTVTKADAGKTIELEVADSLLVELTEPIFPGSTFWGPDAAYDANILSVTAVQETPAPGARDRVTRWRAVAIRTGTSTFAANGSRGEDPEPEKLTFSVIVHVVPDIDPEAKS